MKRLLPAVVLLLSLAVGRPIYCQTTVNNTLHVHGQETIDGSKHPELIPDAIAYHLVLIHYANVVDRARYPIEIKIAFAPMHLSGADRAALIGILRTYKVVHDGETHALSQGEDYRPRRDAHAIAARGEIQAKLSPIGSLQFDAFVKNARASMSVAK